MTDLDQSVDPFEMSESSGIEDLISIAVRVYNRVKAILKKHKFIFAFIVLVGMSFTIYKLLTLERTYVASILFMLQEDDKAATSTSTIADPLSAFLLTRATSQTINIDRLKEIAKSQKVITNVLFSKCIIRGREDFLINHYLIVNNYTKEPYFKNFRGLNGLNRNQYRVFFSVLRDFNRSIISIEEQKSGAFNLKVVTKDEELSKVISEIFYQNISNFYIDKTTEKAQRNYIFLRNRLDSIKNLLYATEYQVANFEDRAQNLLLLTARVPQARQMRNTEFYKVIYLETLKTFEASKVTLNNITPIFQVLTRPYYPLYSERKSRIFVSFVGMLITGAIIVFFLAILYFKEYIWPKYKEMMVEDMKQEGAPPEVSST